MKPRWLPFDDVFVAAVPMEAILGCDEPRNDSESKVLSDHVVVQKKVPDTFYSCFPPKRHGPPSERPLQSSYADSTVSPSCASGKAIFPYTKNSLAGDQRGNELRRIDGPKDKGLQRSNSEI